MVEMLVSIIVSYLDRLMKNFFLVRIPFLHFQFLGFLFPSHMHLPFVPVDEIVFSAFSDDLYHDTKIACGHFKTSDCGDLDLILPFA